MRNHFDIQLQELNLDLIKMGSAIEEAITMAVNALMKRDVKLADEAIEFDNTIDDMERGIERRCLKLLLQQQPVASDLRKISSALKMITDMERIGDHASDISEITKRLSETDYTKELLHIPQMADDTVTMVKEAINAYVNCDEQEAHNVILADDKVDDMFNIVKNNLIDLISRDKKYGEQAIDLMMITKYFERIGDHAVNIAEWVIFSITGFHKDISIL
ncbi:MAG: phosphate signaling complex protein PhoU [Oscillospiraceae bacterium]